MPEGVDPLDDDEPPVVSADDEVSSGCEEEGSAVRVSLRVKKAK
jgi:hypothetical protein